MNSILGAVVSGLVMTIVGFVLAGVGWAGHVALSAARGQPRRGLRAWVGLVRGETAALWLLGLLAAGTGFGCCVTLASWFVLPGFATTLSPATALARLVAEAPTWALPVAGLIYALFQTAFWEEMLFRGILARRCIEALGPGWGNVVQAGVFTALHAALFWALAPGNLVGQAFVLVVVLPASLFNGWYVHHYDRDSFAGSWMVHTGANLGTILAYALVLPRG